MMSPPVTQNAAERLAKLRQVADLLARTHQVLSGIGDPPGVQIRDVVLDENERTAGAIAEWIKFEQEKLA